jgi:hypothetical protein
MCHGHIGSRRCASQREASTGEWRPKNGTYVGPGGNLIERCGEFGDLSVELAERSISGHEWGGEITRLTDTAPGLSGWT